jgi:hypothetical protein
MESKNSTVGIVTRLPAGRSVQRSNPGAGRDFSLPVSIQVALGHTQPLTYWATTFFPQGLSGQNMMLTTLLHLVSRFTNGAIILLPLNAFMAWIRKTLPSLPNMMALNSPTTSSYCKKRHSLKESNSIMVPYKTVAFLISIMWFMWPAYLNPLYVIKVGTFSLLSASNLKHRTGILYVTTHVILCPEIFNYWIYFFQINSYSIQ